MKNQNLRRRINKIEEKFGISGFGEIIEIPLDHGQVIRSTRQELDEFIEWLKGRENNGQELITTA